MAKRIDNFANIETPKDKKLLLNLRHVDVKFNVRGRILNAIRDVSLQIYEGESLAIVGESGSGKSVLTKTFAGMLDSNGYVSHGKIIFSDEQLSKTNVKLNRIEADFLKIILKKLTKYSHLERACDIYRDILALKKEHEEKMLLTKKEHKKYDDHVKELNDDCTDLMNTLQTLDKRLEEDKARIPVLKAELASKQAELKALNKEIDAIKKERRKAVLHDEEYMASYKAKLAELNAKRDEAIKSSIESGLNEEILNRNNILAKEAILSFGRYPLFTQVKFIIKYLRAIKKSMLIGKDLSDKRELDKIYSNITFRVDYVGVAGNVLEGHTIVDCARVKYTKDWQKIRGCKIATVFQDPMTSLNPIITIGRQIMTVIIKHQKCSEMEARRRALSIMAKVGIPDPDKRFDDYPFQYSGGMRQRIVIAIALSCQPKILICDEPTTALDVTIQAQIIRLIKDLSKDLGFTTVYITHDLGVVANVADRVAVLYGGQIVELGSVEDIFYEPAHPYTWALLSSLPQLAEKGSELFSISGTPPSLYNKIVGDAFAPRSNYAMAIDFKVEPPMYQINDHHWAKTWLLDERAPKVEKPEIIRDLHKKMSKIYASEVKGF